MDRVSTEAAPDATGPQEVVAKAPTTRSKEAPMYPLPKVRCRLLLTAAATAVLPFLPLEPRLPSRPPHVGLAFAGTSVGGLRVAIDPITRQRVLPEWGGVPGASPQLQEALQQSASGLTIVQRADGSKYVDLRGHFMCGIAVHVVDGRAQQVCTDAHGAGNAAAPPVTLEAASAPARAVPREVR